MNSNNLRESDICEVCGLENSAATGYCCECVNDISEWGYDD